MNKKICWGLVCTPDYQIGAWKTAELLQSLHTKYPIEIIAIGYTNQQFDILLKHNLKFTLCPPIIKNKKHINPTLISRINKSYVMTLQEYDIVCNIDVDILFKNSLDFIIDKNSDFFDTDIPLRVFDDGCGGLNSLCFLCKPKLINHKELIKYYIESDIDYDAKFYTWYFINYKQYNRNDLCPVHNLVSSDINWPQSILQQGQILHFNGDLNYWDYNNLKDPINTMSSEKFYSFIIDNWKFLQVLSRLSSLEDELTKNPITKQGISKEAWQNKLENLKILLDSFIDN